MRGNGCSPGTDKHQSQCRKMLLEECGYDVFIAASGATALQLFSSHPIDLVLLDYRMPEMNGDVVADRM